MNINFVKPRKEFAKTIIADIGCRGSKGNSTGIGWRPAWKAAHREFHAALLSACHSPTLMAVHWTLFDRAERYRALSAALRPLTRDKLGEHRALMQGLDANLAVLLIESHIRNMANNVTKYAKRLPKGGVMIVLPITRERCSRTRRRAVSLQKFENHVISAKCAAQFGPALPACPIEHRTKG